MITVFQPRPLPGSVARAIRGRLGQAHRSRPFSTADPRDTVQRVTELLAALPVELTVCRGGLDLRGVEVDHVWLALEPRGEDERARADRAAPGASRGQRLVSAYVLDAAFPLYEEQFVAALRRFVVGEAEADDLEVAAAAAGVEARVMGEFPPPMRYVGQPVWSQRA